MEMSEKLMRFPPLCAKRDSVIIKVKYKERHGNLQHSPLGVFAFLGTGHLVFGAVCK